MSVKKEASVAANVKGAMVGGHPDDYDPEKPKAESTVNEDLFEQRVIESLFEEEELDEKVKKVGDKWSFYDDDTGVQLGTYKDRETAWNKQRLQRKRKAYEKQVRKKEQRPDHGEKAPKLNYNVKPIKKDKKESFERLKTLIRENVVSYMFEQQPNNEEQVRWQDIMNSMSKQALASDKKLQGILKIAEKKELEILNSAMNIIKNNLKKTKTFAVGNVKATQDSQTGEKKVVFSVEMKESKQSLMFALIMQNAKPVIQIPDETRQRLNSMGDESKMLRAELISIQEKELNSMHDVLNAFQKRDSYLSKIEKDVDKALADMSPVQIVLLKNLLKTKYKNIK